MSKKFTNKQWISRAIERHGAKYDYSLVDYTRSRDRVRIICKSHGEFNPVANDHLRGRGCPKCAKSMTQNQFIKKANLVHGKKYDYSNSSYVGAHENITIKCKKHGDFSLKAYLHLQGRGCKKCSTIRRAKKQSLGVDLFVEKAVIVHGEKYSYDKVFYRNNKTKVEIGCKKHGPFLQTPNEHLTGGGCYKCGAERAGSKLRKTTNRFIADAMSVHGSKYRYDYVVYNGSTKKVKIICQKHGVFQQKPSDHLSGCGCQACGMEMLGNSRRQNKEWFVKRAKKAHGDTYGYSLVEYLTSETKVKIICKTHGVFLQTPYSHMIGQGCPKCRPKRIADSKRSSTLEFIQKAKIVHGDRFNYSRVKYVEAIDPVEIICKKHGVFRQRPGNHLNGHGCSECNMSRGEALVGLALKQLGFKYLIQKAIRPKSSKGIQYFDFFIPKINAAIEYNGIQHYEPVDLFGGKEEFLKTQKRDKAKRIFCKRNDIKLIEIPYHKKDQILSILIKELGPAKDFDFSNINIPSFGIQQTLF